MKNEPKLINLGCGPRFHTSWTNLDFNSTHPSVKQCNLLNGIPYPNDFFDAVYHSHVLEHFSKYQAKIFIQECYRVLKPGGTIRVVVPDLEGIIKVYLRELNNVIESKKDSEANYDWILLELFDQMIRKESGGEMAKYLSQKEILNEEFVYSRVGESYRDYRPVLIKEDRKKKRLGKLINKIVLNKTINFLKKNIPNTKYQIGNFRESGEIHQWMYDRFSLKRLLKSANFVEITQTNEFESAILNWSSYELDVKDGKIHAPNSLIMEAVKPIKGL